MGLALGPACLSHAQLHGRGLDDREGPRRCAQDVTEDGIKKAYRKLALKIHPDKCSAAGTEEAFKLVSTAFSVLSDPDKKADYDRWGPNGPPTMAAGPRGHPGGFGVSEDEAERIFRMFFGVSVYWHSQSTMI